MKPFPAVACAALFSVAILHAAPGDLDPAFLSNLGAGLTPPSYPTFDNGTGAVNAVALQPDGKIIAGGNVSRFNHTGALTSLKRLNADGTLDTTFNAPGGVAGAGLAVPTGQTEVNALLVEADGSVFVGGTFASYNGVARSGILKLRADGTLDTVFNTSGVSGTTRYVLTIA
ncbi:MAG TPA: hypothetical protein VK477_00360, partial [Acidobacteriota bacterium]|nr:hypothetical protein [Acidobacteriota bacterium]